MRPGPGDYEKTAGDSRRLMAPLPGPQLAAGFWICLVQLQQSQGQIVAAQLLQQAPRWAPTADRDLSAGAGEGSSIHGSHLWGLCESLFQPLLGCWWLLAIPGDHSSHTHSWSLSHSTFLSLSPTFPWFVRTPSCWTRATPVYFDLITA